MKVRIVFDTEHEIRSHHINKSQQKNPFKNVEKKILFLHLAKIVSVYVSQFSFHMLDIADVTCDYLGEFCENRTRV